MNAEVLFERDMLYPTSNLNEPGSVHIQVFSPNSSARIPVVLESKTNQSPLNNLDSILRIMQSDIFDRIFIDVRKTLILYIKASAELSREYGGKAYVRVAFDEDSTIMTGADSIE